jgi:Vps16, N-terminal region
MDFEYVPQLQNASITDYLLMPRSSKSSSSSPLQILVTD